MFFCRRNKRIHGITQDEKITPLAMSL